MKILWNIKKYKLMLVVETSRIYVRLSRTVPNEWQLEMWDRKVQEVLFSRLYSSEISKLPTRTCKPRHFARVWHRAVDNEGSLFFYFKKTATTKNWAVAVGRDYSISLAHFWHVCKDSNVWHRESLTATKLCPPVQNEILEDKKLVHSEFSVKMAFHILREDGQKDGILSKVDLTDDNGFAPVCWLSLMIEISACSKMTMEKFQNSSWRCICRTWSFRTVKNQSRTAFTSMWNVWNVTGLWESWHTQTKFGHYKVHQFQDD